MACPDEQTCWPSHEARPAVGHPPTAKVPHPRDEEPDAQPGNGPSRCTVLRWQLRGGRVRALTCKGEALGHASARGSGCARSLCARCLTFIASSGRLALMRGRDAVADAGGAFRISEPSPALRRVAELGGVEEPLADDE
jgi:hypothetical protein